MSFKDGPHIIEARRLQLRARDRDQPCVILWSMASEPLSKPLHTTDSPPPDGLENGQRFLAEIFSRARWLDAIRPATRVSTQAVEWVGQGDAICAHSCSGGHGVSGMPAGVAAMLRRRIADLHARGGEKPVIITASGADAMAGVPARPFERWSDDDPSALIALYLQVLGSLSVVTGAHPWALADFKTSQSIMRVGSLTGVLTRDRRRKPLAHPLREKRAEGPVSIGRRQLLQAGGGAVLAAALSAGAAVEGEEPTGAKGGVAPPALGTCYYPEQWPQEWWAADAAEMARRGIRYVRIAEFAWALMEPEPGRLDWAWLDRAIETLGAAGLRVVLGTPTAAPPKWLVDRHPEILPVAENGQVRGFGSRRHYTLASPVYWRESRRIVAAQVERYGRHPHVAGWQIDNELGCHDTVESFGPVDLAAFKDWLRERYGSIEALNTAWGNSFWSMRLGSFDEVVLPARAVTETSPTARLDFRRFSSEQLIAYAQMQAKIIRAGSPGRFVTTNAMAFFGDFDHFALGRVVDFVSWDSYPLGHTAGFLADDGPALQRYARTGHPDVAAFNHDLIRGTSRAPFWIMEQQPGPVNWARWNGVPEPGMVRLWTWEAFAHGAATVSHFRWRQARFAQEQMHAGLNRPDRAVSPGGLEVQQVHREIEGALPALSATGTAPAALVLDYASVWYARVQPQGADFDVWRLAFAFYSALRRRGLDVDIVAPGARLDAYRLVLVPTMVMPDKAAVDALAAARAVTVFGPRSGSKTPEVHIPANLPPGPLQALLPLKVIQVGSMRPGLAEPVAGEGIQGTVIRWREWLETDLPALASFDDGGKAVVAHGQRLYVAGWPDDALLDGLIGRCARLAGIDTRPLPADLRLRRRGDVVFAINYGAVPRQAPAPAGARFVLGAATVPAHGVAAWRMSPG